ncbi:MAG TPA: helix-turn-helix domain-containing protein [Verrucomicrobiae bacterium]|nr:helix-turn-helix domain-containing protein [Verrucomicrobiae bacterium]
MKTQEIASAKTPNPAPTEALLEPLVYTIEETAKVLNISTKSVRRLIARGLLTPCNALRKILIPRQQIIDFLKRTCAVPKW